MATIYPRKNKDGSTTWRVMIRRKGLKPFFSGFTLEYDAREFVRKYENINCLDPENFNYDKLKSIREREFERNS